MLTKEQRRERDLAKCRHFNGVQNKECDNKIKYPEGGIKMLACFGPGVSLELRCDGYNPLTPEELDAKEAEFQRHMDLMRQGLSSCCEAPFDTSQVITKGQFKNHGPRFCSKCHKLCFMV